MHWMQRIHRPTARLSMLMKATDLAAAISCAETARFNPSQLCKTRSTRIQVRLNLDFLQRSTDRGCRGHFTPSLQRARVYARCRSNRDGLGSGRGLSPDLPNALAPNIVTRSLTELGDTPLRARRW